MVIDRLASEAEGLNDKYLEMAVEYIRFLQSECKKEKENFGNQRIYRRPGGLEKTFELPEDFDETPECFRGYL